jgi:dCTP deaminase
MSIMNDRWIIEMATNHGMIEPFEQSQRRDGVISYGVSSYGYDMRVANEFRIFTNVLNSVVDPKFFDPKSFVEFEGDVCIVPPNSFALARSVEYFRIPRDVVTITVGKSTYARCGSITNVTPFEPEWEGFVTLEISNTTPLPARIYANEGIAKCSFSGEPNPRSSPIATRRGSIRVRLASPCPGYRPLGVHLTIFAFPAGSMPLVAMMMAKRGISGMQVAFPVA